MSRHTQPYIQATRKGDDYEIIIMRAVSGGHSVKARATVPASDMSVMQSKVEEMLTAARVGEQIWEKQANGDS